MGEPPSAGAAQVRVAEPLPATAATPIGAPGAVGAPELPALRTTVAANQTVLAPVPNVAFGVAPAAAVSCSSATSSISLTWETFTRLVKPEPAVRVLPKPESA